MKDEALNTP